MAPRCGRRHDGHDLILSWKCFWKTSLLRKCFLKKCLLRKSLSRMNHAKDGDRRCRSRWSGSQSHRTLSLNAIRWNESPFSNLKLSLSLSLSPSLSLKWSSFLSWRQSLVLRCVSCGMDGCLLHRGTPLCHRVCHASQDRATHGRHGNVPPYI